MLAGCNVCLAFEPARKKGDPLELIAVIHEDEEVGYWAEIPILEGCVSEGETMGEIRVNIAQATAGVFDAMMERLRAGQLVGFPSLPKDFAIGDTEQDQAYSKAVLHNFWEIVQEINKRTGTAGTVQVQGVYEKVVV